MIAITTSSSIRVKPRRAARGFRKLVMTGTSKRVSMGRNDVGIATRTDSVDRPAPAGRQLAGLGGSGKVLELRRIDTAPHLVDRVGRGAAADRRERPGVATTLQRGRPE
jgi:hypothetical protein